MISFINFNAFHFQNLRTKGLNIQIKSSSRFKYYKQISFHPLILMYATLNYNVSRQNSNNLPSVCVGPKQQRSVASFGKLVYMYILNQAASLYVNSKLHGFERAPVDRCDKGIKAAFQHEFVRSVARHEGKDLFSEEVTSTFPC